MSAIALCLSFAAGCVGHPTALRGSYSGPTDSLIRVAQAIDANNQAIPTLWATHQYEASIVDDRGKTTFVNGDGALLYKRPMGLRLVGKKDVIGDVFEVGSTETYYWLKLLPPNEPATMWYGEHQFAGRPCVERVPIQPNLVLDVLGIGLVGTDFTQMPSPVMRFNPDADAYMMVWVQTGGGPNEGPVRLIAQREVWYDRKTKLPTLVILFDANGRPVLRANLGGHRGVETPDVPPEKWPRVATSYKLYFPDSGSTLSINLLDVKSTNGRGIPNERGIAFPGINANQAGVARVVKLDQNCKD